MGADVGGGSDWFTMDTEVLTSPLDPTALSLRVFHMSTVPASLASSELALGWRAVDQRFRSPASCAMPDSQTPDEFVQGR